MVTKHIIVLCLFKRKNEHAQDLFRHIPFTFVTTYNLPAEEMVNSIKIHLPVFAKFYLLNPEYFHMK